MSFALTKGLHLLLNFYGPLEELILLNLSTGTDHNQVIQLLLEQLNRIIFRFHQICSTICVWLVASIQHFAGLEDDFSLVSPYPLKYFGGHQFQLALSNRLDLTDRCWIALFILKADAGGIMVPLAFISIDRLSCIIGSPTMSKHGRTTTTPHFSAPHILSLLNTKTPCTAFLIRQPFGPTATNGVTPLVLFLRDDLRERI